MKCNKCGYDDQGTGDTAHACSVKPPEMTLQDRLIAYPSSELLRIGYESEEILRKRDAKIREDMLDRFRCKQMDYANEIEREMADELEQGK